MTDVAREYGGALFELADEEKVSDVILSEIQQIRPFFGRNSDYMRLLTTPSIGVKERTSCIDEAFKGQINLYLCNFLKIMTERSHAYDIEDCFDEFERLYNEKNNIAVAKVTSAVELTETQKEKLAQNLGKRTGKNVRLICNVDPSLIGGISVSIDGEMLDGSVSSHLSELRRKLSDITI